MDIIMPQDNLSMLQRLAEYGIIGYIWIVIISVWGGTVRYVSDVKKGKEPSLVSWLYEACISGFVGVITAMLCQYYQLDFLLTSAITGISAHNGTRALIVITEILKKNSSMIEIEQINQSTLSVKTPKQNEEAKK